jgi:hypothetical protein
VYRLAAEDAQFKGFHATALEKPPFPASILHHIKAGTVLHG